jgi:hypothetical protein
VVGLASLAYLWVSGRVRTWLALAFSLPLLAALIIGASRASVLELSWVVAVMAVFLVQGRGISTRRVLGYAALTVLVAMAVTLALSAGRSAIFLEKLGAAFHSRELHVRYVEWEAALRTWVEAPWFGVGAGSYPWAQFTTATPWAGEVRMLPETNAHNLILHLLAETGLVGAALVLIALGPWLWRACVAVWRPGGGAGMAWVLAVVGVELVHSLVEYPLWNVEFLGLAALVAGLGSERCLAWRLIAMGRVIAVGGALIGALFLARTAQAFALLERTWFAVASPAEITRARASLLRPYVDLGIAQQVVLTRADLGTKLAFNTNVVRTWPIAPVVMRQVVLLAMADRDAEAEPYVHHLLRLNPAYRDELRTIVEGVPEQDLPASSALRQSLAARQIPTH